MSSISLKALSLALLFSCSAAWAADLNKAAYRTALIHTERDPRAKKFFWLMPGKIVRWHYEWVMPDGSTVTKVEETHLDNVPDRRPLRESHPNLAIIVPATQAIGTIAGPFLAK